MNFKSLNKIQSFEWLIATVSLVHTIFALVQSSRANMDILAIWVLMPLNILAILLAFKFSNKSWYVIFLRFNSFISMLIQFLLIQHLRGYELY